MALAATVLDGSRIGLLDTHYPTLVAGVSQATRCSFTGPAAPDLAWLKQCVTEQPRQREVTVFIANAQFAGLVVVWLFDLRIEWECINANHPAGFQSIAGDIIGYCNTRYGTAWGVVENPAVRAAMLAAQPRLVEDGITLRMSS